MIGRTAEVRELFDLLASSRLVTLTGPGGSGKTRLALEVARRLKEEGGHVGWVELAALEDSALFLTSILEAVGVRSVQPIPDPAAAAPLLGTGSVVLVLDNCEHLVEECAELVEGLLRAHPLVRVLATSREALGVRGERAWLVPPLSLPDGVRSPEEVARADAVALFVERAREVRADFRLTSTNAPAVAEICTRLDGIPLSIELAAARVKVLSPEQIRDRLDDALHLLSDGPRTAIPRHRTLQAAFRWSYDLLAPGSRALLERLSVFRGSFDLDQAEAVAGRETLEGISRLIDRSLVQVREEGGVARYVLLETIRQFAAAQFEQSAEREFVRRLHARNAMAIAEAAAPHVLGGRGAPGWMERLERDDANLHAALEWALGAGSESESAEVGPDGGRVGQGPGTVGNTRDRPDPTRIEIGLRLATALLWYWFARGQFAEGREYLSRGIARSDAVPAPVRARSRICLAHLAFWQGEPDSMGELAREALTELEGTPDPVWRALALTALGIATHLGDRPGEAASFLDEAESLVRPLSYPTLTAFTLYWQGIVAQGGGDRAMARACLEEAADLGATAGDAAASSHPLGRLGRLLLAEGDPAGAREALLRALAGHREIHDRWGMVLALEGIAGIAAAEGRLDHAVRIVAGVEAIRRTIDAIPCPPDRIELDRIMSAARAALGPARVRELRSEGIALGLDEVVTLAESAVSGPSSSSFPSGGHRAVGLRVRALGPLEVEMDGHPLDPHAWSYSRPREALVYLLLRPRGGTRDEIGQALWADSTPAQTRNSVHVTLHHLRKALGHPDRVVLDGDRYRLAPEMPISWDGGDFEEGLREALDASRRGEFDRDRLSRLLALYRGELLEEHAGTRWLEEARDRFRRLKVDGHMLLARILMDEGDPDRAVSEYEAVIRQEELNEDAHRGLMTAWARAGHRDRAIRHYQRLVVVLAEILQVEPEEETRDLYRRIQKAEIRAGG